ncbi:hypothetical protein GX586_16510 [bacterium]|nr:hypothetical protein [bacterium]
MRVTSIITALCITAASACVYAGLLDGTLPSLAKPAPKPAAEQPAETAPAVEPAAPAPAAAPAATPAPATAADALPFSVSIGGQAAKAASPNAPYAALDKPVAADAEIVLGAKADMVIINVFPSDAKGNAKEGATPAIIIINKGEKGTLASTMDKKKLEPGTYIANIVIGDKGTSRVMFEVK